MIQHCVKSKSEGIKFPCSQCDYKATKKSHLVRHTKSKHEGVKFTCSYCDYKLTRKSSLLIHVKSQHQEDTSAPLKCFECEYLTTNRGNFRRHINSIHTGIKCPQCDFETNWRQGASQQKKTT